MVFVYYFNFRTSIIYARIRNCFASSFVLYFNRSVLFQIKCNIYSTRLTIRDFFHNRRDHYGFYQVYKQKKIHHWELLMKKKMPVAI